MATSYDEGLIPLFTTQFTTNLELMLQQKGSLTRPHLTEGFHVGKMASPINQVAPVQARSPTGRFAPKAETQPTFVRRWVFPQESELDQLIDSFDELQTIVDPKSAYVTNAAFAIGRAWDDAVFTAAFGTNYVGQDAASLTQETFNTSNFQVGESYGASSSVGLTVDKILNARQILQHWHNDLDADPVTLIIGSQQETDLMRQQQVVSTEYNDQPVLVDGRLRRFLGCDIVVSERVPYSGTVRNVLAFVKSGLYLGIWQDVFNRISIRNELSSEPWDVYTRAMFGATRTQPGKLIQIQCYDTTGADITP